MIELSKTYPECICVCIHSYSYRSYCCHSSQKIRLTTRCNVNDTCSRGTRIFTVVLTWWLLYGKIMHNESGPLETEDSPLLESCSCSLCQFHHYQSHISMQYRYLHHCIHGYRRALANSSAWVMLYTRYATRYMYLNSQWCFVHWEWPVCHWPVH